MQRDVPRATFEQPRHQSFGIDIAKRFLPYLPKPLTSRVNAKGRFGKQDFVYVAADDIIFAPPVNG